MNILLTNDDGIFTQGIYELGKCLIERGNNVTIIAPEFENSGKSHSITLRKEILVKKTKLEGLDCEAYSVAGTPSDSVRVAVKILNKHFDYCFSGCNLGYNVGMNVLYSGTVSAAMEANIFGIKAFAISTEYKERKYFDFKQAANQAIDIFDEVKNSLNQITVLNINVPYGEIKGHRVCKLGDTVMDKYRDEKLNDGYILELYGSNEKEYEKNTDKYLLNKGYVSITPLLFNLTNHNVLNDITNVLNK